MSNHVHPYQTSKFRPKLFSTIYQCIRNAFVLMHMFYFSHFASIRFHMYCISIGIHPCIETNIHTNKTLCTLPYDDYHYCYHNNRKNIHAIRHYFNDIVSIASLLQLRIKSLIIIIIIIFFLLILSTVLWSKIR
jgi:hypothetical protein